MPAQKKIVKSLSFYSAFKSFSDNSHFPCQIYVYLVLFIGDIYYQLKATQDNENYAPYLVSTRPTGFCSVGFSIRSKKVLKKMNSDILTP